MSLALIVNGVDRTVHWSLPRQQAGEATFERQPGGRAPGRFVLYDLDGASGFRPTAGQSVSLTDGGTTVFAGVITDLEENGLADLDTGVTTTITVADVQSYPSRATYTVTYPAGTVTLKQILQDLVAHPLAPFSITLDAAQATGAASFTDLIFQDVTVEAILNQLQQLTGWPWRLPPTLALKMVAPATESSGLSLSDSTPTVQGKVAKKKARSTTYANTIVQRCGPSGTALATQRWVGDGVTTSWVTDIAASDPPPALVMIDDGVTPRLATIGAGAQFTWDRATHTLTRGTDPIPAVGTKIVLGPKLASGDPLETDGYTAQYPFYVTVADAPTVAAEGPWVAVPPTREDILVYNTGVAVATAELAQALASPWTVTVRHRAGLGWPGQTIVLSFAQRAVSGTYMILSVTVETDVDGALVCTMDCLEGNSLQRTWIDYFKNLANGGGAGGSITGGIGTLSTTVLSAPVFLGGSRKVAEFPNPAAWTPVIDYLPYTAAASFTGLIRVQLFARLGGIGVTARLFDITAGAVVPGMVTSKVTSTASVEATATGAITAGHAYRLEIEADTNGGEAFGIGALEAA